jgi:hypothetical protein
MRREGTTFRPRAKLLALAGAVVATLAVPAGASAAYTTPTSLDFGNVPVGTTSPPQTVTLTADCSTFIPAPPLCLSSSTTDLVNVSPSTSAGAYTFSTSCPAGLAPLFDGTAQSCPIDVVFTPGAGGLQPGTLNTGTLGLGGLNPAPTVALSGTGVPGPGTTSGPGTTRRSKCRKHKRSHRSALAAKKRKCKQKRR